MVIVVLRVEEVCRSFTILLINVRRLKLLTGVDVDVERVPGRNASVDTEDLRKIIQSGAGGSQGD